MENCNFCKIIRKEKQALIMRETSEIIVFSSLENHPLVVPKKHIKDIYALDAKTGNAIMEELVETSKIVKKALGCDGIYITQANEPAAGQDVLHLHFHVYPRWVGQPMNQTERVDDMEREATFHKLMNAQSEG